MAVIDRPINSAAASLRQWAYQEAQRLKTQTTPVDSPLPTDPVALFNEISALADTLITWVTQDPR